MVTRILIILFALTLSASAQRICPPNQVNRNGLVGRWLVPGKQTGSVAQPTLCLDDSGNGNHGTTSSSPNYGVIYSRPAMNFNGSQAINTTYQLGTASAFTLTAWVRATSWTSAYNNMVGRNRVGSSDRYVLLLVKSNGKMAPYLSANSGVSNYDGTGINTLEVNTWYHLVYVYSSTGGTVVYVNANVDGTGAAKGAILPDQGGLVIAWDPQNPRYFNGAIAEVRAYNRVLSAAEIRAIYQGEQ